MQPAYPPSPNYPRNWETTLHDININAFTHHGYGGKLYPLNQEQLEYLYTNLSEYLTEKQYPTYTPAELNNLERIIIKTVNEKNLNTGENPQLDKTIALCHEIFAKVNSIMPKRLDPKILQLKDPNTKDVRELDAELIEYSDGLINNPHLEESIPENDVDALVITPKSVFDSECQTFLFTNFKKRVENFSDPLPHRLITNINKIIEFLTDFENERAELLFDWSERYSIVIPNHAKHEFVFSLSPELLARFIASGQLRKGESTINDLYNVFCVLFGRIEDIIQIKKIEGDKGELVNFLKYALESILKHPSGSKNPLEIKKLVLAMKTFVATDGLFSKGYCSDVERFFNSATKVILADNAQVEHPGYELLLIRKLSPTIDVACSYQDKNRIFPYDLSKLEITKSEYDDLCVIVKEEVTRVPDCPNVLKAYIRARYLMIDFTQSGYQQQIINKMNSGELELNEALTAEELEFDPIFSKELLTGLLDLLDKKPIDASNVDKMFDIYQFCIHLANMCNSVDFFVNGMIEHFPSLIRELKEANKRGDVSEADYPTIMDEIKMFLALVNKRGLVLSKQLALYKISTELGITPPLVSIDSIHNEIYVAFMQDYTIEELVKTSRMVLGVHPQLEKFCLQKIIDRLRTYMNANDNLELLTVGYQIARETGMQRALVVGIGDNMGQIIERSLYSLDLPKLAEIVKLVLNSYPDREPVVLDLTNQRPSMAQVRMLAGIPFQLIKLHNTNWLAHNRFHRCDRNEIAKLFPRTKIVWE